MLSLDQPGPVAGRMTRIHSQAVITIYTARVSPEDDDVGGEREDIVVRFDGLISGYSLKTTSFLSWR